MSEKAPVHFPPPPYIEVTTGVYPSAPQSTNTYGGYPQQPNYGQYSPNPQPTALSATVITVQPATVVLNHRLGPYPCLITCPNCHQTATTEVIYQPGLLAWLICGIMFIFGFWFCCCIPFCIDSCQDTEHRCRNCRHYIGTCKRM